MTKEELKAKHPNSSPEEIDALHAQIHGAAALVDFLYPHSLEEINKEISLARSETAEVSQHPDTSKANAALRKARAAKKRK